ncbi:unnamed protein product [Cuscuta epithymum]|uniref:Uncharacterized protein n=1 Tax=Cuscuta epithymum TaxID=186058 RepID=A0AAV0EGG6_9ASTE|nr:unnamed protein product [Cuscuta epithymum]
METMIDITPKDPIPTPTVGPLDQDCLREGLIVCDRQKIKGKQGVSLDALVGIFTRIGREVEEIGVANTFSLAERVAYAIEEARPLLAKVSISFTRKETWPFSSLASMLPFHWLQYIVPHNFLLLSQ